MLILEHQIWKAHAGAPDASSLRMLRQVFCDASRRIAQRRSTPVATGRPRGVHAQGIGAALARALHRAGAAHVCVCDLDGAGAERVAADIGGTGLRVDVRDADRMAARVAPGRAVRAELQHRAELQRRLLEHLAACRVFEVFVLL